MKRSKPSLRERKRYITFNVISNSGVTYDQIKKAINTKLLDLLGEKGVSGANPRLIKNLWNEKEQRGVLKVGRAYVNDAKIAQSLVRSAGKKKVTLKTGKVFGTLRKIKRGVS